MEPVALERELGATGESGAGGPRGAALWILPTKNESKNPPTQRLLLENGDTLPFCEQPRKALRYFRIMRVLRFCC